MPDRPTVALVLATSTGGIGRHVRSVAEGLASRGEPVTVLGPGATQALFDFEAVGARFAEVEIASGPRPVADLRAVRRLHALVRNTAVVHAHGLRAGLVAALALPRTQPLVVTWHNAVLGGRARRAAYGAIERVVARRADITLAASEDLVARARALGGRDVRFFPVAAPALPPPSRPREEIRSELGAGNRPLLVSVGRLHSQKSHDVFVDAVARLARTQVAAGRPAPLAVIAGDGPQEGPLADRIARTRAPVRLLGRRTDVSDLLAAADVVVLASQWEARALVAQEALRAGVPLVATAVGGLPGLVGPAADLVPPGDAEALAAGIEHVLDDDLHAAELRDAGPRVAASWPDEDQALAALMRLYLDLTSRSS